MTRALWLGWVALLGVLGVLASLSVASAEPKPSGAPIDRVACARAPGVPDHVDIWVVLGSGRIFYDKPLFHKNLPSDAVVYVYKPNDSTCRKKESTAAVTQAAPEPKTTAPPEKVAPPKKDDKPKPQDSPKAVASATSAEAQDLEARRQRAQTANPTNGSPKRRRLPKAVSNDHLAKEDEASGLPLAKRAGKAAPAATSGLPLGKRATPPGGVTLPAFALTEEEAFHNLFNVIRERLDAMEAAASTLVRSSTLAYKDDLKNKRIPLVSKHLTDARRAMQAAVVESDTAKRAAGLKRAGDAWHGMLIVTQLMLLDLNMALVVDWADKELHQKDPLRADMGNLTRPLKDYARDTVIQALLEAAIAEDRARMNAALPAGMKRYQEIVAFIPKWTATIGVGAVRSGRVVMLADLGMIAISVYQAWKAAPGLFSGGTPSALLVTGLLPGGVALGARVSLPSIAIVLEGIRKLVAIGALDAAIIGSVGLMGGDSSVALPELQRPTSLAVQNPGPGTPTQTSQPTSTSATGGGELPKRFTHTKHHPNSASPEPKNVDELFKRSIPDKNGARWARDANGTIHRFSPPSNGRTHWNRSTAGKKGIRMEVIDIDIRRALAQGGRQ